VRILLTGVAGFLGSNLLHKLITENHEVIGLDDLSTGTLTNIRFLLDHPKFTFTKHDVRKPFEAKIFLILLVLPRLSHIKKIR
jgi:nucleoside-diphosphate-sugar epimerase